MTFTRQVLFAIAAVGLFVTGALWGSHFVANAQSSAGNPVKLQDGTNNTYLAEVTSFKALKVDGSAITQPIAGQVTVVPNPAGGKSGTLVVGAGAKYGVSPDLGYAKTLTVCAPASGLASNFIVDQSIDGTTWVPITQLPLQSGPSCISLPPTRFVRISSGVGTGFYQVSY
ncbi:MAG TPA: hypothetical protein VGZ48_14745 [Candidatus Acidoferrales bacterium]|jgi:hypothetical protein|nr:hypothetical protein [Candidatus Acidoferrales bacterium]